MIQQLLLTLTVLVLLLLITGADQIWIKHDDKRLRRFNPPSRGKSLSAGDDDELYIDTAPP